MRTGWLHGVPVPVAALFAMNVLLVLIPVLDFVAGSPVPELRKVINLDAETTVQSWYSSMQWCLAGLLVALIALIAHRRQWRGAYAAGLFALACIAFSMDEIVGVHEWLGHKSDALLPGGDRGQSVLIHTGLWPFVVGIPVVAALALLVLRMRHVLLPVSPRALRLLVLGLALTFGGALVIELGANFVDRRPGREALYLAQLVLEESLEMFGVSVIVWSACEWLGADGVTLHIPARRSDFAGDAKEPRGRK